MFEPSAERRSAEADRDRHRCPLFSPSSQRFPSVLLTVVRPPDFAPLISLHLLAELQATLERKSSWPVTEINTAMARLSATCEEVTVTSRVQACRDEDDNRVLECALDGKADAIITGDKDLLSMGSFAGIPIYTIRQFLDALFPQSSVYDRTR